MTGGVNPTCHFFVGFVFVSLQAREWVGGGKSREGRGSVALLHAPLLTPLTRSWPCACILPLRSLPPLHSSLVTASINRHLALNSLRSTPHTSHTRAQCSPALSLSRAAASSWPLPPLHCASSLLAPPSPPLHFRRRDCTTTESSTIVRARARSRIPRPTRAHAQTRPETDRRASMAALPMSSCRFLNSAVLTHRVSLALLIFPVRADENPRNVGSLPKAAVNVGTGTAAASRSLTHLSRTHTR